MKLLIATVLTAATLVVPSTPANALCALDPDDLSLRQMIKQGTTGERQRTLFLGKVVSIKDVDPGRGGDKIAKLAVAESPVGYAPLVARVHFWKPPPGTAVEDNLVYHRRGFYAVVANRLDDGSFNDDAPCRHTRQVTRTRFWDLVELARDQH